MFSQITTLLSVILQEAWRLLDSGRLRAAARLGAALTGVSASLADLLSCPLLDSNQPPPASIPYGEAVFVTCTCCVASAGMPVYRQA